MSIAMLVDNPAGSRELYERILHNLDHQLPLGGILHLAGPAPDGGWRVIEIWESPEEAKRFLTERFAPALRAAGFEGPTPRPQFWPVLVHEVTQPAHESVTSSVSDGGAR
ncbi:MAG: hypothetical protein M3400_17110 [Actinomycetota bacterium]|nr:hypothetical protein [Actinomycetota bacterium]